MATVLFRHVTHPALRPQLLVVPLGGVVEVLQALGALAVRDALAEFAVVRRCRGGELLRSGDETPFLELFENGALHVPLPAAVALVAVRAAVGIATAPDEVFLSGNAVTRVVPRFPPRAGVLPVETLVPKRAVTFVGRNARATFAVVAAFGAGHVSTRRVPVLVGTAVVVVVSTAVFLHLALHGEEVALLRRAHASLLDAFQVPLLVTGFPNHLRDLRSELSRVVR